MDLKGSETWIVKLYGVINNVPDRPKGACVRRTDRPMHARLGTIPVSSLVLAPEYDGYEAGFLDVFRMCPTSARLDFLLLVFCSNLGGIELAGSGKRFICCRDDSYLVRK